VRQIEEQAIEKLRTLLRQPALPAQPDAMQHAA
jgi:DNA-directed RNA polymerase sigma subunit (sigma70/sigma32)